MIAVLIGCSLRTVEAAALKLKEIQLREGQWVSADLNGKGGHIRTVPISSSSFLGAPPFCVSGFVCSTSALPAIPRKLMTGSLAGSERCVQKCLRPLLCEQFCKRST